MAPLGSWYFFPKASLAGGAQGGLAALRRRARQEAAGGDCTGAGGGQGADGEGLGGLQGFGAVFFFFWMSLLSSRMRSEGFSFFFLGG